MPKVYITRKKLNEDINITDPTLAQQFLAVKKQMADKRTKRDQLSKSVNQIDSELNILEKNLIAIEVKAAQQQGETVSRKPEKQQQQQQSKLAGQDEIELAESLSTEMLPFDDFRKQVIVILDQIWHDGETLVREYSNALKRMYDESQAPRVVASTIKNADELRNHYELEEDGYIGGDTAGKIATNMATPIRVAENLDMYNEGIQQEYDKMQKAPSNIPPEEEIEETVDPEEFRKGMISTPPIGAFENVNESVYDEIMDELEDEKDKLQQIQDFILQVTQKVDIDINTPDDIEINDEEPEVLEPEPEPEVLIPEPVEDEPFEPVDEEPPFDLVQYEPEPESEEEKKSPFELSRDEELTNETLKSEDKAPYEPELMEEEYIETEIEMLNYEDDDEPTDEYVFHVKIDEGSDGEIIAKIFRDDEEDFWTVRVVEGDEEPLQDMEFDPRLDKLDIIGKLASIYDDIEIIDPKEYEYLLDDKEKVDAEYYSDLVEENLHESKMEKYEEKIKIGRKKLKQEYENLTIHINRLKEIIDAENRHQRTPENILNNPKYIKMAKKRQKIVNLLKTKYHLDLDKKS